MTTLQSELIIRGGKYMSKKYMHPKTCPVCRKALVLNHDMKCEICKTAMSEIDKWLNDPYELFPWQKELLRTITEGKVVIDRGVKKPWDTAIFIEDFRICSGCNKTIYFRKAIRNEQNMLGKDFRHRDFTKLWKSDVKWYCEVCQS